MKIILDPGHGGHDSGGKSLGIPEKTIATNAMLLLWQELALKGHSCVPTRVTDIFVELADRASLSNQLGADLFISLHGNASPDPQVRGPWTIYSNGSEKGKSLASEVQGRLAIATVGNPKAFYPDQTGWVSGRRLAVLRQTRCPAILVELGFMTNQIDYARLVDPRDLRKLAKAVAEGVEAYEHS